MYHESSYRRQKGDILTSSDEKRHKLNSFVCVMNAYTEMHDCLSRLYVSFSFNLLCEALRSIALETEQRRQTSQMDQRRHVKRVPCSVTLEGSGHYGVYQESSCTPCLLTRFRSMELHIRQAIPRVAQIDYPPIPSKPCPQGKEQKHRLLSVVCVDFLPIRMLSY